MKYKEIAASMMDFLRDINQHEKQYAKLGQMVLALETDKDTLTPLQGGHCKGVRSRRRRAAKLRAMGWIHSDKHGWLSPEEMAMQGKYI